MSDDLFPTSRTTLHRQAVRVLPIDPDGRVLLLQCVRPNARDDPFWVTIGGGIEPDEDERQAGVRELWEETGIVADPADLRGPLHHERVEFTWGAWDIVQEQDYYAVDVPPTPVTFAHLEPLEVDTTLDHRWWSLADLEATTEHVLDNQLAAIQLALGAQRFRHGETPPPHLR